MMWWGTKACPQRLWWQTKSFEQWTHFLEAREDFDICVIQLLRECSIIEPRELYHSICLWKEPAKKNYDTAKELIEDTGSVA